MFFACNLFIISKEMHKIAAIDIGSNSIKFILVEVAARDSFKIVRQERERVRLGRETIHKGFLPASAIARAVTAVSRFCSVAESGKAENIIAVATAAVREAANTTDFVTKIKEKTGVSVKVLSSKEEARLIGIAAARYFNLRKGNLLNVDIGGGSTEISLMRGQLPEKLFSTNIGAVGLTEKFIFSNPPNEKELKNLRDEIAQALERPVRELKNEKWRKASGTSGTILNLAALLNFETNGKCEITFERLVGLNEMLARISGEERAKLPGISPQRAEVIVAGGQILEAVMRALEINALEPCMYALREGVIIDFCENKKSNRDRGNF